MEEHHKVTMPLGHRVDVAEALHYLVPRLGCDGWYVASQREHLFVIHLTLSEARRYAVSLECTTPVEKGIYHGSLASSISVLPLGEEHDLTPEAAQEIKSGLLALAWHAHAA